LYVLIFLTTSVFGENTENKKGEMLNYNTANVKNVMKSIDDAISHCNQTLIEKVLVDNGILDKKTSYGNKISKGEFLKAILRIMGVTDEFADYCARGATLETDSSLPVFKSSYDLSCRSWLYEDIEYEEEKGLSPYIVLLEYYDIVSIEDFKDNKNSRPHDDIVLEECLIIMNKCLNKETTDNVISEAEKNGLIKSTDEILSKDDRTLNYDDFCTLLYRMLNHKRGYYFRYLDDYKWEYTFYHKSITNKVGDKYIDHLNFIKTQDINFYVPELKMPDRYLK